MMKRSNILLVVALVLVLIAVGLGAGCSGRTGDTGDGNGGTGGSTGGYGGGGTGDTGGDALTVTERNIAFDPATLTVKVGDTVTFVNEDSAPHVVEIDGKELGQQDQGQKVEWKAEKAGSYPYRCTIHPSMTGEIVVE